MATAAMESLELFRAEDEELVAIVENDACGVDALQCVAGCTFGKGNLMFRDYGKQVYTIYCRSTRSGIRVHFHGKGIPADLQEDRSALTKWILSASNDSILSVTQTSSSVVQSGFGKDRSILMRYKFNQTGLGITT
jgi:formylmethanofuran dehydrogenase subunit E